MPTTVTPLHGFPLETVIVFAALSIGAIVIDLIMHRKEKPISLVNAIYWSIFWVLTAFIFAGYLYIHHGNETASLFLTGYALEKVLSVDNLFLMMAIFSWFAVPDGLRHRILYWGVIGAIVFRAIFVAIGTSLLSLGVWVEIVFALIIVWTAVMMLKSGHDDEKIEDYSQHLAYRLVAKIFPVWPKIVGHNFLLNKEQIQHEMQKEENKALGIQIMSNKSYYATPLLLCLAIIELSDVMFAFDSVPAVIAVSQEPLIVYSAMMFAILGLRTMYFVLEAMKKYLVHLEKAVIVLLFFIALKLMLNATDHLFHHGMNISANWSLLVVISVLAIGIIVSIIFPKKDRA